MKVRVTKHAMKRFLERFNPNATYRGVEGLVENAIVSGCSMHDMGAAGYRLEWREVVFVLRLEGPHAIVVTCFKQEQPDVRSDSTRSEK
jgi:hypothetical protein